MGHRKALKQFDFIIFSFHGAFLAVGLTILLVRRSFKLIFFSGKKLRSAHSDLDHWVWGRCSGQVRPTKAATWFFCLYSV